MGLESLKGSMQHDSTRTLLTGATVQRVLHTHQITSTSTTAIATASTFDFNIQPTEPYSTLTSTMGPEDTYSNHNHHRAQPPPAATIYGDSRRPYQQPRGGDEDRSYYSNRSHSQNGDGGINRGYPTDAYHQSRRGDLSHVSEAE